MAANWMRGKLVKLAASKAEAGARMSQASLYHALHHDTMSKAELRALAATARPDVAFTRYDNDLARPAPIGKQQRRATTTTYGNGARRWDRGGLITWDGYVVDGAQRLIKARA